MSKDFKGIILVIGRRQPAKHFAVHSGPESERHSFDAQVSDKDLFETYLYAFEALVKEADMETVMDTYNRVNGEPCCGSKRLLTDILRGEWGFKVGSN